MLPTDPWIGPFYYKEIDKLRSKNEGCGPPIKQDVLYLGLNKFDLTMPYEIENFKDLKFYIDKLDVEEDRITKGQLKIKLSGPKKQVTSYERISIYEKIFTFDLAKDYKDKGLEIALGKSLPSGEYTLEEIEAPQGYIKSNDKWIIKVDIENSTIEHVATVKDGNRVEENPPKSLYSIIRSTNNLTLPFYESTLKIINKKPPMEFYVDKVDEEDKRIETRELELKLTGPDSILLQLKMELQQMK